MVESCSTSSPSLVGLARENFARLKADVLQGDHIPTPSSVPFVAPWPIDRQQQTPSRGADTQFCFISGLPKGRSIFCTGSLEGPGERFTVPPWRAGERGKEPNRHRNGSCGVGCGLVEVFAGSRSQGGREAPMPYPTISQTPRFESRTAALAPKSNLSNEPPPWSSSLQGGVLAS